MPSPQSILVLGAGGLLGRHVRQHLQRERIPHTALTSSQLDITDPVASVASLDRIEPTVVINCAALCNFQACEEAPEKSRAVNQDAPLWWGKACAERGVRLVHFSSDYIFDGEKQTPYTETDAPDPRCVYAVHKRATETGLLSLPGHLILRVAWLFGIGGKTFMSLLPQLLMEREEVTVAAGKRGSCLYVGDGAIAIVKLAQGKATGILNLVHRGETSWEEFAKHCLDALRERGLHPRCKRIFETPFSEMPSLSGFRPAYSVLQVDRAEAAMGSPLTTWETGLVHYLDALQQCGDLPLSKPI